MLLRRIKSKQPILINQELFTSGDNAAIVQRGQHLEELAEHPRLEKLTKNQMP